MIHKSRMKETNQADCTGTSIQFIKSRHILLELYLILNLVVTDLFDFFNRNFKKMYHYHVGRGRGSLQATSYKP